MNKILIGASVVLLVITVGLGVYVVSTISQTNQLEKQVASGQEQIKTLGTEKLDLVSENSRMKQETTTLSGQVKTIQAENAALNEQVKTLNGKVTELNDKVKTLTSDLEKKTTDWTNAIVEKNNVTKKFMCSTPLSSVDFTSNQTVNNALVKYVEKVKGTEEPITSKFWNVVWTNYNYSIHTISVHSEKDNVNYLWKFTAYFKGESYGSHVDAIFYNDDQCWLYLDK